MNIVYYDKNGCQLDVVEKFHIYKVGRVAQSV
jgi:hypothetical protein